jgi:hypothetical protein
MGAYVYRLKGTKAFDEMLIEGKMEKVYHLVYWYKPYYSMWEPEPRYMRGIRAFEGRLKSIFKNTEVKYAIPVHIDKEGNIHRNQYALQWKPDWVSVVDDPDWQQLKIIRLPNETQDN